MHVKLGIERLEDRETPGGAVVTQPTVPTDAPPPAVAITAPAAIAAQALGTHGPVTITAAGG
jgi:hypothetical protein